MPTCPRCIGRELRPLATDGLGPAWLCIHCSSTFSEEVLDDDRDPPMEELMRAPVTLPGKGSSSSKGRKEEKPGTKQARAEARERRYFDGPIGPWGKPERDRGGLSSKGATRVISIRVTTEQAAEFAELVREEGLTLGEAGREALEAWAALQWARARMACDES